MIDSDLKCEIIDTLLFSEDDEIHKWNKREYPPDYDFTASSEITIEPENAKTINEIDKIKIVAGISGSITFDFERKQDERPK